ncbi:RusA family crossover junction endodeoxyribonuclease [Parvimonas micra]|uniref:RusA family crossover junction endodeoxyribonuclease n=1 Tax=Parvimonas micra TaxID=33033 RepID=UPI00241EADF2|nr:RusA family crossover junction endodeoxyribonuclease [Parvimonas micra]
MYTLEIDVRPFPKERPRLSGRKIVYTPYKTRNFENRIAYEWKKKYKDSILKGAVKLDLVFVFKKAKTCKKTFHTQRPDIDNLEKAILDGLNKVAFVDDCQVVELNSKKVFSDTDKILITVTELN